MWQCVEFAAYGTKWLSCAGGSWQVIGGAASGSNGQLQFNNSGAFAGLTVGGDGVLNTGTGALTITKTNGVSFAPSATIDATNAGNISSGTLSPSRLPASINGTSVPANTIADTVLGTTSAATGSWLAIPNCPDSSGNHLNYNTATHTFNCGVSSSGSGGGAPGGTPGQIQFNNSGSLSGFSVSGDGTLNTSTGVLAVARINGGSIPSSARLSRPMPVARLFRRLCPRCGPYRSAAPEPALMMRH